MDMLALIWNILQQGAAILIVCLLLYGLHSVLSTRIDGDDEILKALRETEELELELRRRSLRRLDSPCTAE